MEFKIEMEWKYLGLVSSVDDDLVFPFSHLATGNPQPEISYLDAATLHIGVKTERLDLSTKDQRLLLENLVIQHERRDGHVLQNL